MKKDEVLNPNFLDSKKILLVEDNPLNQQLGIYVFKRWGQEVHLAENGKIAIEMLEKESFDLILMDIQMPVMDGNDTTRYIRENMGEKSSIPIIALTAHATVGEEKKCLDMGMDDYLSKPFNANVLLEKIYYNLEKKEKQIEKDVNIAVSSKESNDAFQFDFSYLYEVADNDEDFVQEMIQLFLINVPISIAIIKDTFKNNEILALKNEMHKLKSSLALLGIEEGFQLIVDLNEELNDETINNKLKIDSLIEICEKTIALLERMK